MKKMYFITGVNGVGKTTVIGPLKNLLGPNFEIHDFDERGVPNNAGREWRLNETQYWISLGEENSKKGITTIICGFAKPSEITNNSVGLILLDANEKTIRQRLENRYKTAESIQVIEKVVGKPFQKFIDDNVYYSSVLRKEADEFGITIIDTTLLTPENVAIKITSLIK